MAIDRRGHSADADLAAGDGTSDAGASQPRSRTGLPAAVADSDTRGPRGTRRPDQPCPLAQRVRLVELVEVVTENGRETTRPVAARDQYINLDAQVDPRASHPEYGREIRLKARVMWAAGDLTRRPIPTQTIYWYVTAGADNRSGLAGNELPALNGATTTPLRATATTDAEGWTSVVPLRLSTYGGDQFTANATEDAAYTGGLPAGAYTVWRRFWFQVTEMADGHSGRFTLPTGVTGPFIAGYRTVYALFEEQGPRGEGDHVENMPDPARRSRYASPHFRSDSLVPFKCHVVTIDYASEVGEQTIRNTVQTSPTQTAFVFLWTRGTGTHPWKVRARCRATGGFTWHCRRVDPPCPGHSSHRQSCSSPANAKWACGARDCPGDHLRESDVCDEGVWHCNRVQPSCPGHSRRHHQCAADSGTSWTCDESRCPHHAGRGDLCGSYWQDIPDSALRTIDDTGCRGFKKIEITFGGGLPTPSSTRPVEYELVVRSLASPALGWGGGSTCVFLCTGMLRDCYSAGDGDLVQRSDLTHEIGHALGLLNLPPASGTAHDAWRDTAHGRHCNRPGPDCVMYYASSTTRATIFHLDSATHAGCHDYLRRQEFARGNMSHWNP